MMKLKFFVPAMLISLSFIACVDQELDLKDLSKLVGFERDLTIPLGYGSMTFEDLSGNTFDSLLISDGDTIKLFLVDDISFDDTISLGDLGENMDFEYVYLHNEFRNMFPVALNIQLYLHDSIQSTNIDTIYFSGSSDEIFLPAAPVDDNELVIEEDVENNIGVIALEEEILDKLFTQATHIVFAAEVPSTSGFVKILDHYTLDFKLGLETRGYYETDLESNE